MFPERQPQNEDKPERRDDSLPVDPKALEKWNQLPQNAPSKEAMPPATGGMKVFSRPIFLFFLLLLALVILSQFLRVGG